MNESQTVLKAIFGGLGITELILILLIVLLVFGAGKLPQIGDALGKSIRNFKSATKKGTEEDTVDVTPKALEDKDKARTVDVETGEKRKA